MTLEGPSPAASRLGALRIVIGLFCTVYVLVRAGHLAGVARFPQSAFAPVGPVSLLSAPLPVPVVWLLVLATVGAGIGFVLGWRFRVTGPLFAALLLWVTSYRSSWGMVFHTENLMVLHVIALALFPAADAFALDAPQPRPHAAYSAGVWLLGAITVSTYLIAGVSKLRLTGASWISGDVLQAQIAYDSLRKAEAGSLYSPLARLVLPYSSLFAFLAALTMVVEIGAPLALLGRRLAVGWSVAAWSFHVGVVALMAIAFPYPLAGVAFASFFPVERWVPRVLVLLRRT